MCIPRGALRSTVRVTEVPEHVFQYVLPGGKEKERNPSTVREREGQNAGGFVYRYQR